jgi:hypothetical protein
MKSTNFWDVMPCSLVEVDTFRRNILPSSSEPKPTKYLCFFIAGCLLGLLFVLEMEAVC